MRYNERSDGNGINAPSPLTNRHRRCLMARWNLTLQDRFWSKVDRSGGDFSCWIWTASVVPTTGYGQFSTKFGRAPISAHRMAWKMCLGYLPDRHVCHSCDNRRCVNPWHLWLGTDRDNVQDMIEKGRNRNASCWNPKCHLFGGRGRAKVSPEDVMAIRAEPSRPGYLDALSARFGINHSSIQHIRSWKTWNHCTMP